MNISDHSNVFQRALSNYNKQLTEDPRQMSISGIIEGQTYGGSLYMAGTNSSFPKLQTPPGCPYLWKYSFDPRCRLWYLQTSKQNRVTPIQPTLIFGGPEQYLVVSLCKSQRKYQKDQNGNMIKTNCTYSVNCLSFKLTTIKNYFSTSNYNQSKTFMIDPRSEIMVYNQLASVTQSITGLYNSSVQLFPNDTTTQNLFLKEIRSRIQYKDNSLYNNFTYKIERQDMEENNSCEVDPYKLEKQLGFVPVNFEDYVINIKNINLKSERQYQNQSFILKHGEKDEVFVTINYINIIEKLKEKPLQRSYEVQDLFVIINVLPKQVLTSWTDKIKAEINYYIMWISIGSLIMCGLLIIIAGVISYQVAIMIEKPLIHMINLLNKLDQEGCTAAIILIDSQIDQYDSIFLSKDSEILFESFKNIFQMVRLATEDIFTVDDSCSLLRLNYSINFFKEFNNIRVQGICYNNMGNIHFQNGRYFESMEAYQDAIVLAQQEAGFYEELEENEQINDTEPIESKKQNQNLIIEKQPKKRLINSVISILRRTISTVTASKIQSEQQQIDSQLDYQKRNSKVYSHHRAINNQAKYQNALESLKDIIFDRKINFSHAFFMHNIQQETESQIMECRISSKALNNPINFKSNQDSSNYVSQAQTMFDWENYENILLDLIQLNQELPNISFSRTVILFTQLSLCHLKMGNIEKAAEEQSMAIDNYKCALAQELLKNKQYILKLNTNPSITNSKILMAQSIRNEEGSFYFQQYQQKSQTLLSSDIKKLQTYHDEIIETEKSILEIDENFSLMGAFRKRQAIIFQKFQQNSLQNLSLYESSQALKKQFIDSTNYQLNGNDISIQIEQVKEIEDSNEIQNSSHILQKKEDGKEDLNKNDLFTFFLEDNKKRKTNKISELSSYTVPTVKFKNQIGKVKNKQRVQLKKQTSLDCEQNLIQQIYIENSQITQKKEEEKEKEEQDEDVSFIKKKVRSEEKKKGIFSQGEKIQEINTTNQVISQFQIDSFPKRKRKSLTKIALVNSKIKNFEQIQRYELPSDVLLYYITLQESRLLLFENNPIQSAYILTDLLEKSKYYLPYYRFTCLNVLSGITNSNQQIQCEINKLIRRFDQNISLNCSIAILDNSSNVDGFNTISSLIKEVLTKEEDKISLLLYDKDNLQQIIPSISLKQLLLSGEYLTIFLKSISEQKQEQSQLSLFQLLSFNQQQSSNQNSNSVNHYGEGNLSNLLKANYSQEDCLIQNNPLSKLKIDFEQKSQKLLSDSLEQREQRKKIQFLPQQKISTILDNLNGEKENNFPLIQISRINNFLEDINRQKYQLLEKELSENMLYFSNNVSILENSNGQALLKSDRKNKLFKTDLTKAGSLNHSILLGSDQFCENKTFEENQNSSTSKINIIIHLAARQCILNLFNQDLNKYDMHKKQIQQGICSKEMKFVLIIIDSFEFVINSAYQMLSNLLFYSQIQLLVLILNKEEQLKDDHLLTFKDEIINGKSVIKYFFTAVNLLQYIRNKREPMKNFGIPLLVEHLNM